MTTKLILSMDASVIQSAKQAARARNISVSAMLARLMPGRDAMDHSGGRDFVGPITQAASGLVELAASDSDADLLGEAL